MSTTGPCGHFLEKTKIWFRHWQTVVRRDKKELQSVLHTYRFCISGFNQLWIKIFEKKIPKFQKAKLEFTACWQT